MHPAAYIFNQSSRIPAWPPTSPRHLPSFSFLLSGQLISTVAVLGGGVACQLTCCPVICLASSDPFYATPPNAFSSRLGNPGVSFITITDTMQAQCKDTYSALHSF
ncbi:unnamed protein product [Protopolystoma xenopodis]|uniref:Uncharacterized protein n=1 Tax=Protopolystoma xenopodis TaxID=117903 RepID=A0A448WGR4_9PLAT|nr:unnamed protein product [Protopolystoma xenopodis]